MIYIRYTISKISFSYIMYITFISCRNYLQIVRSNYVYFGQMNESVCLSVIVSCVATTVESTMQRVKAELIAPIMNSLSEQSREIEILKKSISGKNDTIETHKVKFSKHDKAITEMNKQIDTASSGLDNL